MRKLMRTTWRHDRAIRNPEDARHSSLPLRRGVAMLLVLSAVGMAAVLGVAILTSAALQNHTGRNVTASVPAESLAESGIELACLYLLYPKKAPAFSGTYWPGAANINFGSAVAGTVDVSVSSAGSNLYTITSTGVSASGLRRQITATVLVNPGFRVRYGAAFSAGPIVVPSGSVINSDIQVSGGLTNYGSVWGRASSSSLTNYGLISGGWTPLTAADKMAIPAHATVRDYSTYTYQGKTYSAKALSGTLAAGTVLGPTEDNPAGVFRQGGSLIIYGNVTINGTLMVDGGPLKIMGEGITINPAEGFPAGWVSGDLQLVHSIMWRPQITFNGLVWMDGNIKSPLSGLGPAPAGTLSVNGALISPRGTIDNPFRGKINVALDRAKIAGVELDPGIAPASVQMKSFR